MNQKKGFVNWLISRRLFSFPRKKFIEFMFSISLRNNRLLGSYDISKRLEFLNLIREIRKETNLLLNTSEAYQIYLATLKTKKIEGDIAEVGVFKGGSAKIIAELKGNKNLHLFDTFEGLPDLSEYDDSTQFHKGDYIASFQDVKNYLNKYPQVYFYKGLFPATAESIKKNKFSFVNLDVDIYESTLDCLNFFYSRMTKGGIIISHDYSSSTGVKKAFDDFFKDKSEIILELTGTQCMVIKL